MDDDEKPGRLLVVDDEELNRDMLSRRLQRHGYEVLTASGGEQALAILELEPLDVVLLDIMMPGISGLQALARLRETKSPAQLPVIMATAKSDSQDVVEALKLGASDYVTKPLDFPVVLARVKTQLALKRAVAQIVQLQENMAQRNRELSAANTVISEVNERMKRELGDAARIQKALLPTVAPRIGRVRFAWSYHPCVELGGDHLDVFQIDEGHIGLYLLDVTGHGVPAALLATALAHVLTPHPAQSSPVRRILVEPPGYCVVPPSEVVADLNLRFLRPQSTSQFFTMVYAVINTATLVLRYVRAGHPGPIRILSTNEAEELPVTSPGVAFMKDAVYEEGSVRLEPGDRVYFYSDGVTEAANAKREEFDTPRLVKILRKYASAPLEQSLEQVTAAVHGWCAPAMPADDVTLLALEIARA